MGHPLDSAYRKVTQARHHLKTLQLETRAFTETDPYQFTTEFDEEGIGHVRFKTGGKTIPKRLSLIAGDAVYNLRSALDHLVYQLALLQGGTGETNGFPIFEEPAKYRHHANRLLRDVSPDHRARIEALQPYHIVFQLNPRRIPKEFETHAWLFTIGRLANLDKHRLLLAGQAIAPAATPKFEGVRRATGQWRGEGSWVGVEDGAELFTITELEPLGELSEVKVKPNPVFTITFGDSQFTAEQFWTDRTKGAVSAADLLWAADAIEAILGGFTPEF